MNRLPLHKLGDFIDKRGLSVSGHCYKCNKISFRTQQEAKKEASDMRKRGNNHVYVYACPKGNGWHLTSMKPKSSTTPKTRKQAKSSQTKKQKRLKK
tara:strand:- start:304 stop:594 length:291 start_codon:yes stop_codon:yes gene_type:complete